MIEVRADQRTFDQLADALAEESDGQRLRRDLGADVYRALEPAAAEVRSRLMVAESGGPPHGEPLLPAIAAGVTADVRVSSRSAGARIRASKRSLPRGFINAPKRFNQRHFRRHVYGHEGWVFQVGAPGWFDGTLSHDQAKYQRAVEGAMEKAVRRITRRV